MFTDPLPDGYDVHLYSQVLHDWNAHHVEQLLTASLAALPSRWLADRCRHPHQRLQERPTPGRGILGAPDARHTRKMLVHKRTHRHHQPSRIRRHHPQTHSRGPRRTPRPQTRPQHLTPGSRLGGLRESPPALAAELGRRARLRAAGTTEQPRRGDRICRCQHLNPHAGSALTHHHPTPVPSGVGLSSTNSIVCHRLSASTTAFANSCGASCGTL
jgi:hypothetical protein